MSFDDPREGLQELHLRRIEMRGALRPDGLFEIEGRLVDTKPFEFTTPSRDKIMPARQPLHDMGVRLVFDHEMVVHEVSTFTDAAPYAACPGGGQMLQSLKGLRIGKGWSKEVHSRLSGSRSCTHLRELLIPMASAAYQSLTPMRANLPEAIDETGRPLKIDSCHAYASEGEVVRVRWPAHHRPRASSDQE